MHHAQLCDEVARHTGEDLCFVRHLGFTLLASGPLRQESGFQAGKALTDSPIHTEELVHV